jgi:hypothetical protein
MVTVFPGFAVVEVDSGPAIGLASGNVVFSGLCALANLGK